MMRLVRRFLRGIVNRLDRLIDGRVQTKIKITPFANPILMGRLLEGRCVLITGGTRGIGYAIASACLHNGASVVITGRKQETVSAAVEKLKKECSVSDDRVDGVAFDVSDAEGIQAFVDNLVRKHRIDTLVNNAGIIGATTPFNGWDDVIGTNLKSVYVLSNAVADYMIREKIQGNILNMSSSSALRPCIHPYHVAKWGVRGLTLGLAKKLIRHGIVVNSIAPGPTATAMMQSDPSAGLEGAYSPLGRFTTPDEIANLSVVLISSLGRSVVGDTLYASGGSALLTLDDVQYY